MLRLQSCISVSLSCRDPVIQCVYICESCWCNCIEVLATICSPLGGPGSSRRQWSGYVQHITAADVLTEKKLPFQIFPTAVNKIQMLDWSCFYLTTASFSPPSPSSVRLHPLPHPPSHLVVLPCPSASLIIYFALFFLPLLPHPSPIIHPSSSPSFSPATNPEPFLNKGKYLWHSAEAGGAKNNSLASQTHLDCVRTALGTSYPTTHTHRKYSAIGIIYNLDFIHLVFHQWKLLMLLLARQPAAVCMNSLLYLLVCCLHFLRNNRVILSFV